MSISFAILIDSAVNPFPLIENSLYFPFSRILIHSNV